MSELRMANSKKDLGYNLPSALDLISSSKAAILAKLVNGKEQDEHWKKLLQVHIDQAIIDLGLKFNPLLHHKAAWQTTKTKGYYWLEQALRSFSKLDKKIEFTNDGSFELMIDIKKPTKVIKATIGTHENCQPIQRRNGKIVAHTNTKSTRNANQTLKSRLRHTQR